MQLSAWFVAVQHDVKCLIHRIDLWFSSYFIDQSVLVLRPILINQKGLDEMLESGFSFLQLFPLSEYGFHDLVNHPIGLWTKKIDDFMLMSGSFAFYIFFSWRSFLFFYIIDNLVVIYLAQPGNWTFVVDLQSIDGCFDIFNGNFFWWSVHCEPWFSLLFSLSPYIKNIFKFTFISFLCPLLTVLPWDQNITFMIKGVIWVFLFNFEFRFLKIGRVDIDIIILGEDQGFVKSIWAC